MRLPQLNRLNFDQEVIRKDGLVLVLFHSLCCAECRAVAKSIEEIVKESYPVTVGTVNSDWNPQFTASHKVDHIPTLILYKNGVEQSRILGLHSKEDILDLMASMI